MAYTLRHKQHVSVDLIYARLLQRQKQLSTLSPLFFFWAFFQPFFYGKGSSLLLLMGACWKGPQAPSILCLPAKTLLPVGAFLLLIQGLSDFIKNIVFVAKGEQL
jgi:TRAP-type mannitol/chloroaromatic compound transport system permease small subunit